MRSRPSLLLGSGLLTVTTALAALPGTAAAGTGLTSSKPEVLTVKVTAPTTARPGTSVTLSFAKTIVPKGDKITGYKVDYGDRTKAGTGKSLPRTLTHKWTKTGTYTIRTNLTDLKHHSSSTTTRLTIKNASTIAPKPPTPAPAPAPDLPAPSAPAPVAPAPVPPTTPAPTTPALTTGFSVAGHVVDTATGAPLSDVFVHPAYSCYCPDVEGVRTGTDGVFGFKFPSDDLYAGKKISLVANEEDAAGSRNDAYAPNYATVTADSSSATTQIALSPGFDVSGRATDSDGSGVPSLVHIPFYIGPDVFVEFSTHTAADGSWLLRNVSKGKTLDDAVIPDNEFLQEAQARIDTTVGPQRVTTTHAVAGVITGTITYSADESATARTTINESGSPLLTTSSGTYRLARLAPGQHALTYSFDDYEKNVHKSGTIGTVTVTAGQTTTGVDVAP
jgi:hypothetical protein